jgi:hypothetical protein
MLGKLFNIGHRAACVTAGVGRSPLENQLAKDGAGRPVVR